MKILLIGFNVQQDIFPLGLSYLKAYAKKFYPGLDIRIKEFGFGHRFSYDINKNIELAAISYILMQKPDLIAFSCYIWGSEAIKEICKTIKKINPKIKIMLGGADINEKSINEYIDFIISGEGEIAFKEIIGHLNGKIKIEEIRNIIYKKDNKIIKNQETQIENLDEIPFPYSVAEKKEYAAVRIETSRGCPFGCKYCLYAKMAKVRNFSIDYLDKNIGVLFSKFKFRNLTILDANLNLDKERMKQILEIIDKNAKTYDKITVNLELKPELIDKECVKIMENCSFRISIELGLQSTNKEVLKEANRPYDLEKVKQALRLLDNSKIKYKIDLMYGLPKDNFFKFLNSTRFILNNAKKQNSISAHHFMLLNNTKFYHENSAQRLSEDNSSMVIKTNSQNVLDLYKTKLFVEMINEELKLS